MGMPGGRLYAEGWAPYKKANLKSNAEDAMNDTCGCSCDMHSTTIWALVLGGLFIIFLFITSMTVKWWLMLPLAAVSCYLFRMRGKEASGLEKKLCDWGSWIVIVGFFLRDICLSSRLASMYEKLELAGDAARAALNI